MTLLERVQELDRLYLAWDVAQRQALNEKDLHKRKNLFRMANRKWQAYEDFKNQVQGNKRNG